MKIVNLPEEYSASLEILKKRLDTDSIDVTVEYLFSDELSVSFDGASGVIGCSKKHHFARALGLFVENYKKTGGKPFSKTEKAAFDTLSCMLDVSFGTVLTLDSLKEFSENIALMGFNQILFYIEDMYEIPGRPFFGYMRGRYSFSELREFDDHAFSLGVEIVPCMQTLGHLGTYLQWPEASSIKENELVLEPENEKTYEFIEAMIKNSSAPFRSKRIHIGCDETHGLGMGASFKKHGYREPLGLLVNHVNRVAEICKKYGLRPMMWSDMFIAFSSKTYNNYDTEAVISDEIKALVNENVDLVYWHYGQFPGCDAPLIDKHIELNGRPPIFAGGVRIWLSPLTDNIFSKSATNNSLPVCKAKGVKEVVLTVWCYAKTFYQTALLELARYGELCYNDTDADTRERFEFITGASYDAFMMMSNLNDLYETDEQIATASYWRDREGSRFYAADIMQNIMESDMIKKAYSAYHRKTADWFKALVDSYHGEWEYLYRYCQAIFEAMATKFEIVEKLSPAYKSGDKETLRRIADTLLPHYVESLSEMCKWHMYHKDKYLHPMGGGPVEANYGAMKERGLGAIRRINLYLDGEIKSLAELECERLDYPGGGPVLFARG